MAGVTVGVRGGRAGTEAHLPWTRPPRRDLGALWRNRKVYKAGIVQAGTEEDGGQVTYHTNDRGD